MKEIMCQCHQIGGPFIAEDPECPVHGRDAQRSESHREVIMSQLQNALANGHPDTVYRAALGALEYLQSL